MSKIKNSGLDQYATEPIEQQEFGTVACEVVNMCAFLGVGIQH